MKFQNLLLSCLIAFQLTKGYAINNTKTKNKKNIFNYKFYCVKDNNNSCSKLKKNLANATKSLSKILDLPSKVNFEAFVDDVSKYRVDTSKEVLAVSLDTSFAALNPKNNNTISPYPNAKALKRKLKLKSSDEVKDRDFILLLNSYKSDKKYLKNPQEDKTTVITVEIFEALLQLNKLDYPYANKFKYESFNFNNNTSFSSFTTTNSTNPFSSMFNSTANGNFKFDANAFKNFNFTFTYDKTKMTYNQLNLRKNATAINNTAANNDFKFGKFIEANKLPNVIHWKDTLISKGKEHFSRKKYEYRRIIALGDIHGDYDKLVRVLRHANLIDRNNDWIGTDTILVQTGDLTDRGPGFKSIIELFVKIRKQARERGGIVYMLLGNHELYDMQGGYGIISKADFDSFGGYMNREKELSMEGKFGELLRKEMNITMVVDDNLFIHAGLTSKFAKMGIDEINNHAHEILSTVPSLDVLLEDYYGKNKTHPLFTDPLFDMTDGPLWTRFSSSSSEEEVCKDLEEVLKITKAKRMIVGHTIQEYGKIQTRCNNKIIMIDLALSNCLGNYFGYLEILNDKKEIWTRYE